MSAPEFKVGEVAIVVPLGPRGFRAGTEVVVVSGLQQCPICDLGYALAYGRMGPFYLCRIPDGGREIHFLPDELRKKPPGSDEPPADSLGDDTPTQTTDWASGPWQPSKERAGRG